MVGPAFSAVTEGPEGAPPEPPTGGVEGTRAEPQVVGAEGPQEEPTTANAEGPQGEEAPEYPKMLPAAADVMGSQGWGPPRLLPSKKMHHQPPAPAWPRAEASSSLACTATELSVAEIEEIPCARVVPTLPTQPFAIGVAPEEGAWGDDRTFLFNSRSTTRRRNRCRSWQKSS